MACRLFGARPLPAPCLCWLPCFGQLVSCDWCHSLIYKIFGFSHTIPPDCARADLKCEHNTPTPTTPNRPHSKQNKTPNWAKNIPDTQSKILFKYILRSSEVQKTLPWNRVWGWPSLWVYEVVAYSWSVDSPRNAIFNFRFSPFLEKRCWY